MVEGETIKHRRPREDPPFRNVGCEITFGKLNDNSKPASMETPPKAPRKDAEEVWQHQTIQLEPDKQGVTRSQPTRVSLEPETTHTTIPCTIIRYPYAK